MITHDDGVSLFVAGTEAFSNQTNQLPLGASAATTQVTNSVNIGPGTYDLWYNEDNSLPAVSETTSTPLATTPLPATLVERNLSNDEIARQLGIKRGTVEIHPTTS